MIKTEDIPNLENSNFSTKVIKDIAQNILSFLKSNCTKEGHTYWLFKGKYFHDLRFLNMSLEKLMLFSVRNYEKNCSFPRVSDMLFLITLTHLHIQSEELIL